MNRRRFVMQEGSSNKFWEIWTDGSSMVTRHGRAGTAGRETAKAFASAEKAEDAAIATIRAKVKKGYREEAASDAVAPGPGVSPGSAGAREPGALVERLAAALERRRPGFAASLPPPATEEAIAGLEKELGLPLPASLQAVLAWHDGTGDESLFDDLSLSSVRDIARSKKAFDALNPTSEAPGQWWNEKWIPIFDDRSYDTWVIDWAGCFNGKPGQILAWRKDGRSRTILFESFDHWLETFVLALEAGCYADSDDGFVAGEEALGRIRDSVCRGYPKHVKYRIAAQGARAAKFAEAGELAPPARASVTEIVVHPDGARLVLGQIEAPVLSLLDVATGHVERLEETGESILGLALGADGSEAVYLLQTGRGWRGSFELRVRSLGTGTSRTLAQFPMKSEATVLSVAPGLAVFNTPEGIEIRELPSGNLLRLLPAAGEAVAAFSPDGRWLASSVAGSSTIELRAWPELDAAWTVKGDFTRARRFAFDPSGSRLAAIVEGARMSTYPALFDSATGAEQLPGAFRQGAQDPRCLTFSPDGAWLATGDDAGRLVVHDVATGKALWTKEVHDQRVLTIAFSRDGRQIFAGSIHDAPLVIVSTPS